MAHIHSVNFRFTTLANAVERKRSNEPTLAAFSTPASKLAGDPGSAAKMGHPVSLEDHLSRFARSWVTRDVALLDIDFAVLPGARRRIREPAWAGTEGF